MIYDLDSLKRMADAGHEHYEVIGLFEAAMFLDLGRSTQMSRTGYSVVFKPEYRGGGRADLSGMVRFASAQLADAGIDYHAVTKSDIERYQAFSKERNAEKSLSHVDIVVTRPVRHQVSAHQFSAAPYHSVKLRDGNGDILFTRVIKADEEWNQEARHGAGAYRAVPNQARVDAALDEMRNAFPRHVEVAESQA